MLAFATNPNNHASFILACIKIADFLQKETGKQFFVWSHYYQVYVSEYEPSVSGAIVHYVPLETPDREC